MPVLKCRQMRVPQVIRSRSVAKLRPRCLRAALALIVADHLIYAPIALHAALAISVIARAWHYAIDGYVSIVHGSDLHGSARADGALPPDRSTAQSFLSATSSIR